MLGIFPINNKELANLLRKMSLSYDFEWEGYVNKPTSSYICVILDNIEPDVPIGLVRYNIQEPRGKGSCVRGFPDRIELECIDIDESKRKLEYATETVKVLFNFCHVIEGTAAPEAIKFWLKTGATFPGLSTEDVLVMQKEELPCSFELNRKHFMSILTDKENKRKNSYVLRKDVFEKADRSVIKFLDKVQQYDATKLSDYRLILWLDNYLTKNVGKCPKTVALMKTKKFRRVALLR